MKKILFTALTLLLVTALASAQSVGKIDTKTNGRSALLVKKTVIVMSDKQNEHGIVTIHACNNMMVLDGMTLFNLPPDLVLVNPLGKSVGKRFQ